MRSMTGFGRGTATDADLEVCCEIKSVNQRGLEVRARCDRELAFFEPEAVAAVRSAVERGRLDVTLTLARGTARPGTRFDAEQAARLVDELLAFARGREDVEPRVSAADLMRRPELFVVEDVAARMDELTKLAAAAVAAAVRDLAASRAREGAGVAQELESRLKLCEQQVAAIEARAGDAVARLREKLSARLKDAEADVHISQDRLAAEVALLADRVDVREELARLSIHLAHFRELAQSGDVVGRKLDFLCQELTREANTVGSKCSDAETAHHVVNLKAEIERVREQVQNVE